MEISKSGHITIINFPNNYQQLVKIHITADFKVFYIENVIFPTLTT